MFKVYVVKFGEILSIVGEILSFIIKPDIIGIIKISCISLLG